MASDKKIYLNVGNLTSLSGSALDGDDTDPQFRPGGLNFLVDAFGPRIFKYVRVLQSGGVAKGELQSAASAGTDQRHTAFTCQTTTSTGNSTTAADITGATADRHIGMIAYVNDDAGGAGAAPEGEATIVRSNTASLMKFEPDYPLSAALAASDILHVIATYQVEDSAVNDQAWVCEGIVLAENGISANNYGWLQVQGPVVAYTTAAAITLGNEVVAGANAIVAKGAQTGEDWIGVALASMAADNVARRCPIKVTIFGNKSGIAA